MPTDRQKARRLTWILGILALVLLVVATGTMIGSCLEPQDPIHTTTPYSSLISAAPVQNAITG